MKTKIVIIVLSVVVSFFVVLSSWLAYMWIDMSISYTYQESSLDSSVRSMDIMGGLITKEFVGLSEEELMRKLEWQVRNSDSNIVLSKDEREGVIIFESLHFKISGGKVVKVN